MEFMECNPAADFCVVFLEHGIEKMREAGVPVSDMRIFVSSALEYANIYDVLKSAADRLGFPLWRNADSSDVMPLDSWMIVDVKSRALFWSPGA